ncbi:hypothetical protein [Streptomyces sp. NBC_01304]|uniref:hypothetical protein n=1 Tax=Streptomyces sp. NBC_01304 TaxID=2903818 RepID=UPI002E16051A|nr:hypothetical protein OG430_42960 [Streptomyces sp. NBC_01304]
MARQTAQERPVDLPLRLDGDPQPVDGCTLCANLVDQRTTAKANGDRSKISDINVRMRRHLKDAH